MKRSDSPAILLITLAVALAVVLWSPEDARRGPDVIAPRTDAAVKSMVCLVGDTVRIDINKADAPTLRLLPGFGETLSQAVVDYREANGPFESVEALMNVPGVGAARLEAVRDMIYCEGE